MYRLDTELSDNNLILGWAEPFSLFAWGFSLAHATALYKLQANSSGISISMALWHSLKARLQKEWPTTIREDSLASLRTPFIEDGHAIFEALIYDNWSNRLLFRRTSISPEGFSVKDWFLVVGPRRVDEDDTRERTAGVINGPGPYSPGELERNRQDYAEQQRFRALVGEIIPGVSPGKRVEN